MKLVGAACAALVPWTQAAAQGARAWARLDAQALAALTAAAPTPPGVGATAELRAVHPLVTLRAGTPGGQLWVVGTVNLEGVTLANGELAPGTWGEGFVDRRHPHTYVHELMLVARACLAGVTLAVAGGKGFVPFGTDDPMTRPPVRYPVNHHLSQILERAVTVVALSRGPVLLEAALFNGDEPEAPDQWPRLDRFGDSWAARLTARPRSGLEIQGSHARVRSPEHRLGAGPDQVKASASVRWTAPLGGARVYALAEWARTSEADGFFVYSGALAEGALAAGAHQPYVRVERTERPEEERVSAYRAIRPKRDDSVLGISRWTIVTLGYGVALPLSARLRLGPFVEGSLGRITKVGGGIFDPAGYYGGTGLRSVTVGFRVAAGMDGHRMGRYGDRPEQPDHH